MKPEALAVAFVGAVLLVVVAVVLLAGMHEAGAHLSSIGGQP